MIFYQTCFFLFWFGSQFQPLTWTKVVSTSMSSMSSSTSESTAKNVVAQMGNTVAKVAEKELCTSLGFSHFGSNKKCYCGYERTDKEYQEVCRKRKEDDERFRRAQKRNKIELKNFSKMMEEAWFSGDTIVSLLNRFSFTFQSCTHSISLPRRQRKGSYIDKTTGRRSR